MAAPGRLEQPIGRVERRPGAASATWARRHPGRGAPARAGRRAARPSRADGSPSPRSTIDWPTTPRPRPAPPSAAAVPPAHPSRAPGGPCPDPRAPTTCTGSPSRTDPALSPDGSRVAFTVKSRAPAATATARPSGSRRPTAASRPAGSRSASASDGARAVLAGRHDARVHQRSPALRRGGARPAEDAKDREDATRSTSCRSTAARPAASRTCRGASSEFAWSPDGTTLAVLTSSLGATTEEDRRSAAGRPSRSPASRRCPTTGTSTAWTTSSTAPASSTTRTATSGSSTSRRARHGRWSRAPRPRSSPPGRPTAPGSRSPRTGAGTPTSRSARAICVVDVATGEVSLVARRRRRDLHPARPGPRDGSSILALGDQFPRVGYRTGIWRFAADGSDAAPRGGTDLLAPERAQARRGDEQRRDAGRGAAARPDGRRRARPVRGAGRGRVRAVAGPRSTGPASRSASTTGEHYLSGWDAVPGPRRSDRVAAIRSSGTELPEVRHVRRHGEGCGRRPDRSAGSMTELAAELDARPAARAPLAERRPRRSRAGSCRPGPAASRSSLEIHGGPHTLYGWSPMLEWQILAGAGVSVLAHEPARLGGLRRGVQPRQPRRLGRRPDGGRHRRRRPGRSRTASPTRTAWASRAARTAAT